MVGEVAVDEGEPLHPANPRYVIVHATEIEGPGVGLQNDGFDGIPVEAGKRYAFSMFARQLYMGGRWDGENSLKGRPMPVRVRLEDESGSVLGEAELAVSGRVWNRVTSTIVARETNARARLSVLLGERGGLAMDMISLFPEETFRGHPNGLRKDLAETIAELEPAFVRFPGGCLVHGDGLHNIYRWQDTVGPVETRRGQKNIWGYHQSVGLGYYEYFRFCEDIGAIPVPVVAAGVCCQNAGQVGGIGQRGLPLGDMPAYIEDILDLIEWANGPADSEWGRIRAEAGHPEPFGLAYLGVGNEDHITPAFRTRFEMIRDAVKAARPEITVIGTVGPFHSGADYENGWAVARELDLEMVDEHYYVSPDWFWDNLDFYDGYERKGTRVYLGEYAAHDRGRRATLRSALAEAAYMTALERNGDVVTMASYAPLLGRIGRTQWNPDLIYFDGTRVAPTVNYFVQQLFSRNDGATLLGTSADAGSSQARRRLAWSAVRDEETGDTILKIVNGLAAVRPLQIELSGLTSARAGTCIVLGDPDPDAVNTMDDPDRVRPVRRAIEIAPSFRYNAPANSLTVIRVPG